MHPMLSAQTLGVIGGFNVLGSLFFGWAGGCWCSRSISDAANAADDAGVRRLHGLPLARCRAAGRRRGRPNCLQWQAMIQGLAFMSHQLGSFLLAYGGAG